MQDQCELGVSKRYPEPNLSDIDTELHYLFHSVPEPEPVSRWVNAYPTQQWQSLSDQDYHRLLIEEGNRRQMHALGEFFAQRYPANEFQIIPRKVGR